VIDLATIISECPYNSEISLATQQEQIIFELTQPQPFVNLGYYSAYSYIENSPQSIWYDNQINSKCSYLTDKANKILTPLNYKNFLNHLSMPFATIPVCETIKSKWANVFQSNEFVCHYNFSEQQYYQQALQYISKKEYDNYAKDTLWELMLSRHNSVIATDLDSEIANKPYRIAINIRDIRAIYFDSEYPDKIKEIVFVSFPSDIRNPSKEDLLYYYYTDEFYAVFKKTDKKTKSETNLEYEQIGETIPHVLGECPATFIAPPLNRDCRVIRKSLWTPLIEKLGSYLFFYVLHQRFMQMAVMPITQVSQLNFEPCGRTFNDGAYEYKCEDGYLTHGNDFVTDGDTKRPCPYCNTNKPLEGGVVIEKPQMFDGNGKPVETENIVKYISPDTNALQFASDLILVKMKNEIIQFAVGNDIMGEVKSHASKTESEVQVRVENETAKLIEISALLSKTMTKLDTHLFALKFGWDVLKSVYRNFGTQFYLKDLMTLLNERKLMPNSYLKEVKDDEIINTQFRNNPNQIQRSKIVKSLEKIPFDYLEYQQIVDNLYTNKKYSEEDYLYTINFEILLRTFELENGDVVNYINNYPKQVSHAAKILDIQNKLVEILKKKYNNQIINTNINLNKEENDDNDNDTDNTVL